MKYVLPAIAALLLSISCATPHSLSQKSPILEYQTSKSAREVVSCISQKWAVHVSDISTIITADGYMVSIIGAVAGPDATVVISEKGGVTNVRYAERMPSLTPSWVMEAVSSCR